METEKDKLVKFFLWFRNNGEKHIGLSVEQLINKYLETLNK